MISLCISCQRSGMSVHSFGGPWCSQRSNTSAKARLAWGRLGWRSPSTRSDGRTPSSTSSPVVLGVVWVPWKWRLVVLEPCRQLGILSLPPAETLAGPVPLSVAEVLVVYWSQAAVLPTAPLSSAFWKFCVSTSLKKAISTRSPTRARSVGPGSGSWPAGQAGLPAGSKPQEPARGRRGRGGAGAGLGVRGARCGREGESKHRDTDDGASDLRRSHDAPLLLGLRADDDRPLRTLGIKRVDVGGGAGDSGHERPRRRVGRDLVGHEVSVDDAGGRHQPRPVGHVVVVGPDDLVADLDVFELLRVVLVPLRRLADGDVPDEGHGHSFPREGAQERAELSAALGSEENGSKLRDANARRARVESPRPAWKHCSDAPSA